MNHPLRLAALLAALALARCASEPSPSSASPQPARGWQAQHMLADAGVGAIGTAWGSHTSLALDPDGAATVAWDAPDPELRWSVFAVRRDASGTWGAASRLAAGIGYDPNGQAAYPYVSGGGAPIVVWHDHAPATHGIWATCWQSATARWGSAMPVSVAADVLFPQVAGSDCRGLAVWGGGPSLYRAFTAELNPSAGWSAQRPLGTGTVTRIGRFAGGTIVAWNASGALAWSQGNGSGNLAVLGGGFFALGDDAAGRAPEAVLAWDAGGVLVASRYVTDAWSAPQTLGSFVGFRSAAVANSVAGAVFCVTSADTERVRCARARSGQPFGPLEDVSPPAPVLFVDVAIDDQGRTVVAYATRGNGVYAARAEAAGAWGPVQRLDQPIAEADYWEVRVRAAGAGRLLASWMATIDHTAHTTIWAAAFEP